MLAQDIMQTAQALQALYNNPVTPEFTKSNTGLTTSQGFIPYNLEVGAKALAPVVTPFRNRTPRTKGRGSATQFLAVTSYNPGFASGSSWASEGTSGALISSNSVHVTMPYSIASLKNNITFEAQYFGQGQVDAKALGVANLLKAFLIDEEYRMLYGNNATYYLGASSGGNTVQVGGKLSSTGTIGAPTLAAATTGGTLGATLTYNVYQTVLNGQGESTPSVMASVTTGAGTTNSFTITPALSAQGISYAFYVAISTSPTAFVRYTTNGASVTITSFAPGTASLPVTDTTGYSTAFPGLATQLMAPGSGASILALNRPLTMAPAGSYGDIDNLFLQMWSTGLADPDVLYVHAKESLVIAGGTIGAGAPYFVAPSGMPGSGVANYHVSHYTNRVTGKLVELITHPAIKQGSMFAISTQLPSWYPGADIPGVFTMEMVYDYMELDYPPTDPSWPVEVRNAGALLCYLPIVNGMIVGIS